VRGLWIGYTDLRELRSLPGIFYRDEVPIQESDRVLLFPCFNNGPAGIAAGREIYGTPKVCAGLKVTQADRCMKTETTYGGEPVLRINTSMEKDAPGDAMPSLTPAWRLKVIPRADGPGPALKQLIDCSETAQDVELHSVAKGRGTIDLGASPRCDLTPLTPLEYGDAYHMESSYAEGYARIVYDYLSDEP